MAELAAMFTKKDKTKMKVTSNTQDSGCTDSRKGEMTDLGAGTVKVSMDV